MWVVSAADLEAYDHAQRDGHAAVADGAPVVDIGAWIGREGYRPTRWGTMTAADAYALARALDDLALAARARGADAASILRRRDLAIAEAMRMEARG